MPSTTHVKIFLLCLGLGVAGIIGNAQVMDIIKGIYHFSVTPYRSKNGQGEPITALRTIELRFQHRKETIRQACSILHITPKGHTPKPIFYSRLNVCLIPKVGTTFLWHYLNKKIPNPEENSTTAEVPIKRKNAIFVREPYSRMMSGYIGKLFVNPYGWNVFGRMMIKAVRPHATDRAKRCGDDVSFPEFVKYLIYSQEKNVKKNAHFIPLHESCDVCGKSWEYIGHLETIQEDLKYILSKVNLSAQLELDNAVQTIRGKCKSIIKARKHIQTCTSMFSVLRKVWWSFQARGLIAENITLPVSPDQSRTLNASQFMELSVNAHMASVNSINRSQQKRRMLVQLFLQVPLADRLRLRDIFSPDFVLFGYDLTPPDLFPELSRASGVDQ